MAGTCVGEPTLLQARDDAGQVTVFGKGGKTRAVLLKRSVWRDLTVFRDTDPDQPVFRSRKGGGHLDPVQVLRGWVPDVAACDVYVCGPESWAADVRRTALAAGTPAEQIHLESFGW